MGDLLNFDEEEDLFKVPDSKMDKSFDDIFGDFTEDDASPGMLDDILQPDSKPKSASKPLTHKKSLKKSLSMKKKSEKSSGVKATSDNSKVVDAGKGTSDGIKKEGVTEKDIFDDEIPFVDEEVPDADNSMNEFEPFANEDNKSATKDQLIDDFFGTPSKQEPTTVDDLFDTFTKSNDAKTAPFAETKVDDALDDLFGTKANTADDDLLFFEQPMDSTASSSDKLGKQTKVGS